MGTVIDFAHYDHIDRHQLWERFERAALGSRGLSAPSRQAASSAPNYPSSLAVMA
jgi:hypothetical protein